MRIMAGYPNLGVTSRNVLMGNMVPRSPDSSISRPFNPDYSIFLNPFHPVFIAADRLGKDIVVSKEEYGNDRHTGTPALNECNFDMFPSDEALIATRPVCTFRDPQDVFDSWLSKGWSDIDSFIIAYKKLIETFEYARALRPETVFYTYEFLTQDRSHQNQVFQRICQDWGIKFDEKTLEFKSEFNSGFLYRDERERAIYTSDDPKGLFSTLAKSATVLRGRDQHGLITPEMGKIIDNSLGGDYSRLHEEATRFYMNSRKRPARGPQPKP